jgi:hypothetical protein
MRQRRRNQKLKKQLKELKKERKQSNKIIRQYKDSIHFMQTSVSKMTRHLSFFRSTRRLSK